MYCIMYVLMYVCMLCRYSKWTMNAFIAPGMRSRWRCSIPSSRISPTFLMHRSHESVASSTFLVHSAYCQNVFGRTLKLYVLCITFVITWAINGECIFLYVNACMYECAYALIMLVCMNWCIHEWKPTSIEKGNSSLYTVVAPLACHRPLLRLRCTWLMICWSFYS